jgi:transglutaminase-like putative cysteine protease
MNSTLWVEEGGQILKSFTDSSGGMVTYRTTREAAQREGAKADLIATSIVKVARPISNPENSRDVVYKVSMAGTDPTQLFPDDRRQSIKAGSEAGIALLEVKTAGPDDGTPGPDAVDPEFLRSNPMITSDDPRVVALARRAVGASVDPWAKAQAITKWVAINLKDKNFETTFAPADEVARTLAGDCTEHGVLTAAMCRAEGIPARVVTGLVYVNQLGGFGFHMWNEVYVNRRWVAIDATFDQTQVDAVHLKLSDSSLDGVAPFETFLAVSRVFGKLKLEAVEIR